MNSLADYQDLYVQSDTLLFVDIFENFRDMSLKIYELDPAYIVLLPGFAWHACLKIAGTNLELITDINMLLMTESGMRGGVFHVIHSYAEANNKYMNNYDENQASSFLSYLDANNFYACPMIKKRPVSSFKWVKNVSRIDEEFIKNYDENSDVIGYFLKIHFEYPKELHYLHSDLPFSPEKMKINKHDKLVCTLYDKKGYVAHIKNIRQALHHGSKKKVSKAIDFYQEAWLKPYIDMNVELRKEAKSDFEKDFYKLMNNAVFGRSIKNVRRHGDIKLVTDDKKGVS